MNIYLDRVAIWLPIGTDELSVRPMPAGIEYLANGTMVFKKADKTLYRYAKNYKVGKGKTATAYSLFVRTFEPDSAVVEKALDVIAESMTKEFVDSSIAGATFENFNYLDEVITKENQ